MVKDLNDPTNRDTVPAMLTPGEFVLNKEATQMYEPIIRQMNNHGLQQRAVENANIGKKISKLHGEGYDAPGQAYAIAKSMGYNTGGLVDFLKKHEGWRDKAYQDSAGIWTIGYGRTFNADGSPVTKGQTTNKEAENEWIANRAQKDFDAVKAWADGTGEDYTNQELEALASFRYNLGPGGFNQLTADGTRDKATIQSKLPLYVNAGGRKVDGLVNRRNYEMEHAGWGEVKAPAEGSSETTFRPEQEVPPVPEQSSPVPQPVQQQPQQQEEVVDVSPRAEAPDQQHVGQGVGGFGADQALGLLQQGLFGGGAPPMPSAGVGGMQGNKSAQEIRQMTQRPIPGVHKRKSIYGSYNQGGMIPVQHFWLGGLVDSLFGGGPAQDPMAGYANYSQQDYLNEAENFNNPGASNMATHMPGLEVPSQFGADQVSPNYTASNETLSRPGMAEHIGNRFNMESPERTFVPELDTAPPVPGSDEALLQGSSQNVEQMENTAALAKRHQEYDATMAGAEYDPRGNNQVPTPDWQMTPEGMSVEQPVNPEAIDRTPSVAQAWGLPIPNTRGAIPGVPEAGPREGVPSLEVGAPQPSIGLEAFGGPGEEIPPAVDPRDPNAGWANLTQEEFLQEAQPKDVQQADGQNVPPPEIQEEVKSIEANPLSKDNAPKTKAAVSDIVAQQGEEPLSQEQAAAAQQAGEQASPKRIEKAKGILEENFGGLFDKKELARAAVLFAGAMATGMSPRAALAFAGQQYMGRLDAKEAQKVKTAQQAEAAAAKNQPYMDMTNTQTFYDANGKKIEGVLMVSGKNKQYVNPKTGEPIPPGANTDGSIVPGTKEYGKRVQDESKLLAPIIEENMQIAEKDDLGNIKYKSGFKPKLAARQATEWAIQNGIPAEQMGTVLQGAVAAAQNDPEVGNDIRPYLNDQAIVARVGDSTLFQGSSPKQVNNLMDQFSRTYGDKPGFKGKSDVEISTTVMQTARPLWNDLDPRLKKKYEAEAEGTKGMTAFMLWMEDELQGE